MRTTVNLDEGLLQEAKAMALRSRRPLGQVIDDALRLAFRSDPAAQPKAVRLPTFGGGGLQPGVDLEDKEAIAQLLGDNAPL